MNILETIKVLSTCTLLVGSCDVSSQIISNVFNPAIIVFGGALAEVFRGAEPVVRAGLDSTAMAPAAAQVRLAPQALGDDSVLLGAAELAFRRVLADPLGVAGPE